MKTIEVPVVRGEYVYCLNTAYYRESLDAMRAYLTKVIERGFEAEHAKGLLRLMDVHQAIWSKIEPTDETDRLDQQRVKGIIEWKD